MKISVSFMLLLLLGSVSANEGVENKPGFPQDIYAALREMTASLVQLRADLTLQTQEQVQQKTELENLKKQQLEQTAEQKTEVNNLKTEVNKLNQQQLVQQVAFSASLVVAGETTLGPLPTATTLIYKHVPTNIGNAYNSNTGVFTAPVRGAYNFEWSVGARGDGSHGSGAWLVKNSEKVFVAWERQNQYRGSASNGVTLLLEVGDVVSVRLVANSVVNDNENHLNTFSGHLLFTM
ncbi:complement C1q tumor necrosis factor-related protein 3 [Perca flavescens]|uniref:C1q-like-protein n=1 Tax=Perca flavescens TaxID=8167 RepID=C1K6Q1_PERFV|nr:complement C1q tumor necrosis factor-related protein 3-like [Perca flavescens]XP_028451382.1 complement C1q tumor necrosis factor-related protein 3-like [Perca flavescens]XP_028451383.1 complement C1q tumor necrosis factor-related protein 3-like [Perca flavescens]XP_028451385.1 complement C1q tumor necrosis factor-related protein 3-like [Perca flavescens]XP_028451386.1 complement C1q tumor necrosis factor-related protein 3-like [Perca flavescens]XP_028451387.1 complement C1q tumor necrosis 